MRVISLGWGLQSFALAAMSALGELPSVDAAIHADTGYEKAGTYAFAQRWTEWLEERGVRVVTVHPSPNKTLEDNLAKGWVRIPAFTSSSERGGQIGRQCTSDWKISPIRRWLQANRQRRPVEMWLGISLDEPGRIKPSGVGYITNRWPLCFDRPMGRAQVRDWLLAHDLEVPPRSACTFCPYQSRREWRSLQGTPDFAKAIAVDDAIRDKRPPFALYLHSSRIPLAQVDLRSEQECGQMELDGFENECSGSCGL